MQPEDLRSLEWILAERINSPDESWVIIEKIFSGKPCTCFCKMNGEKNLEIKSPLPYISFFNLNPRIEIGEDHALFIPRGAGEDCIFPEDIDKSEIVYVAVTEAMEMDRWKRERYGSLITFACGNGKEKVALKDPLKITFILPGILEEYVKIIKPRGQRRCSR